MRKQKFHLFLHWKSYNLIMYCYINVQFCIECTLYQHVFINLNLNIHFICCTGPLRVHPAWHSQRINLPLACKLVAQGSAIRASHSRIAIATHFKYLICFVTVQIKETYVYSIFPVPNWRHFSNNKRVCFISPSSNYNSYNSLSKKLIAYWNCIWCYIFVINWSLSKYTICRYSRTTLMNH